MAQEWITTTAGVKMPRILYGTAWKKERTADLVASAIRTGFRGIDTAGQPKHYDERLVGVGLQALNDAGITRADLYLQTKFTPVSSQDPEQVPYDRDAPVEEQVAQSFETSKANLQTGYVDCLVLHSPMVPHERMMKAWGAMEKIQQAGEIRQLGISNCYSMEVLQALYADATVKPAILQNRFYKDTAYDAELRLWCETHGVIYQSFWSLTANSHIVGSDTVKTLAVRHGKTPAQIFFRYLSQIGIVPLTGTTSEQHMKEDLAIFDFTLSSRELDDVSLLLKPL